MWRWKSHINLTTSAVNNFQYNLRAWYVCDKHPFIYDDKTKLFCWKFWSERKFFRWARAIIIIAMFFQCIFHIRIIFIERSMEKETIFIVISYGLLCLTQQNHVLTMLMLWNKYENGKRFCRRLGEHCEQSALNFIGGTARREKQCAKNVPEFLQHCW